eukprot:1968252-Pyramimonas_sp.AAC.1
MERSCGAVAAGAAADRAAAVRALPECTPAGNAGGDTSNGSGAPHGLSEPLSGTIGHCCLPPGG